MEETLLHRARLCLFLPPLPSFPTSLAATLRSAATDAGSRHQLQQRIISVVINGDALGNCYRAARSLPPYNSARAISSPCVVQISSSSSFALRPAIVLHPFRSSSTRLVLFSPATLPCYKTAFRASLDLAPHLPKVRETRV